MTTASGLIFESVTEGSGTSPRATDTVKVHYRGYFPDSGKEFDSVLRAVGGIDNIIDWDSKDPDIMILKYTEDRAAKEDKVFDNVRLMRTPVVRNGKEATVGFCPEVWETWK